MTEPTPELRDQFRKLIKTAIAAEERKDDEGLNAATTAIVQFAFANDISQNEIEVAYTMFKEGIVP